MFPPHHKPFEKPFDKSLDKPFPSLGICFPNTLRQITQLTTPLTLYQGCNLEYIAEQFQPYLTDIVSVINNSTLRFYEQNKGQFLFFDHQNGNKFYFRDKKNMYCIFGEENAIKFYGQEPCTDGSVRVVVRRCSNRDGFGKENFGKDSFGNKDNLNKDNFNNNPNNNPNNNNLKNDNLKNDNTNKDNSNNNLDKESFSKVLSFPSYEVEIYTEQMD